MKNELVDKTELGRRLRELRGIRTRVGTAKQIGISSEELAWYERGLRYPTDVKKVLIANYYNKTVQQLFFADE